MFVDFQFMSDCQNSIIGEWGWCKSVTWNCNSSSNATSLPCHFDVANRSSHSPDYESPCKTSEPFCTTTTASSPASGKLHDCCNSRLGRCAITFGARRIQTSFVVRYLGHAKLTVLITNQMDRTPTPLIDRYARRMAIENVISDAIDFFRTDALSSAVPMRINVDTQPTVMAQRTLPTPRRTGWRRL